MRLLRTGKWCTADERLQLSKMMNEEAGTSLYAMTECDWDEGSYLQMAQRKCEQRVWNKPGREEDVNRKGKKKKKT